MKIQFTSNSTNTTITFNNQTFTLNQLISSPQLHPSTKTSLTIRNILISQLSLNPTNFKTLSLTNLEFLSTLLYSPKTQFQLYLLTSYLFTLLNPNNDPTI